MKILQVINAYSPLFGCGPADRCQKMASALAALGHEVTIFTTDHSWDPDFAARTPSVEIVAFPHRLGRFCYSPAMASALAERVHAFDLLHLMNHWTHQNILAYRAARAASKPYLFSPMGALPIVYRSFLLKRAYNSLYGRRILQDAAACIAITPMETGQFAPFGIPRTRIHYLPNAIDLAEYRPLPPAGLFRRRFDLPAAAPLVLFLGRLAHIKGPDLLLDAFLSRRSDFPDTRLVFAGPDYGMEESLRRRAAGVDTVRFVGPLTGEIKRAAYHDADLFAVPSRQENMSIVAVEAAASRTPVLITDACDFGEIASCGAGRVVPATAGALAEALVSLLSTPAELKSLGEAAERMVLERFTWDRIGRQYEALLQRLLAPPV